MNKIIFNKDFNKTKIIGITGFAHVGKDTLANYLAKYFILNNKNSRLGFPSRIQDADIITKLLDSEECFPFAEERRLFYVALTRAKKKVFLLAVDGKESVFCNT